MGASNKQVGTACLLNLQELSLDIARLDLTRHEELADKLLTALAYHLRTDRVSLLLLDAKGRRVKRAFCLGFTLGAKDLGQSALVMTAACAKRQPLLVYNVRETPELLSPWPQTYRTDAFAVYPLTCERAIRAVLCVSNLSAQQLSTLEANSDVVELVMEQVCQVSSLLIEDLGKPELTAPVSTDELTMISTLLEKFDRSMDVRNVFAIFTELVSRHVPFDMLAVIHDCLHEPHQGVVCLQRPLGRADVQRAFSALSHQYQRRHKRSPGLDLSDAVLIGVTDLAEDEAQSSACQPLCRMETFPVFLDNDLFGLVAIAADEATLGNQRLMRLFNLLAHQLLLHIKKGLLLAQSQEMQTVDALTGLYSERHFYRMMEREFDRATRYSVPLCLMIMDVDHFKDVNEAYGFETGDLLLQEISRIIMENMRSTDFVSRYSGERFILVLPETHAKNSEIMANRLRRYIENNSFFIPNTNVYVKVTVSLGVASYLDHKPASLAQFIEFADTALYLAKRNGRNQVVGYSYVINMMLRDPGHEN